MCVIVYLPEGKNVTEEQLKTCYNNNKDGWGIMFAKHGKLETLKDVSSFEHFFHNYKLIPTDVNRALHFRIRTSGDINKANCHPFVPVEGVGLMHNGTIQTPMLEKNMSDTHNFTTHELPPLLTGWQGFMDDPDFVKLIEETTNNSRLLFMTKEGQVLLARRSNWIDRDGVFYSNGGSFVSKWSGHNYNHRNYQQEFEEHGYEHLHGNRRGKRNGKKEKYDPLKATGAKQGAPLLTNIEAARAKRNEEILSRNVDRMIENFNKGKSYSVEPLEEEDDTLIQDEPAIIVDIDVIASMNHEEMLEFIQDAPESAALTMRELIRAGFEAGVYGTIEGSAVKK